MLSPILNMLGQIDFNIFYVLPKLHFNLTEYFERGNFIV